MDLPFPEWSHPISECLLVPFTLAPDTSLSLDGSSATSLYPAPLASVVQISQVTSAGEGLSSLLFPLLKFLPPRSWQGASISCSDLGLNCHLLREGFSPGHLVNVFFCLFVFVILSFFYLWKSLIWSYLCICVFMVSCPQLYVYFKWIGPKSILLIAVSPLLCK